MAKIGSIGDSRYPKISEDRADTGTVGARYPVNMAKIIEKAAYAIGQEVKLITDVCRDKRKLSRGKDLPLNELLLDQEQSDKLVKYALALSKMKPTVEECIKEITGLSDVDTLSDAQLAAIAQKTPNTPDNPMDDDDDD